MESTFKIVPTKLFLNQLAKLSQKEVELIESKLKLLKNSPFSYKKLQGYKNTFEVKLSISNNYSRLIYSVYIPEKNQITIFGIFKRKHDFKDFKRYYEDVFK